MTTTSCLIAPQHQQKRTTVSKTLTLDPDVKAILNLAAFTADSVKLNGALPRPMYVRVNKVLELAGGVWSRKRAAHIFGENPARVLGLAVATGTLDSTAVDISKLPASAKLANFVPDLFPTPADLARRMVDLAADANGGTLAGRRVLEPSAGTGNLLRAIFNNATSADLVEVVAVEYNHALVAELVDQRTKTLYASPDSFQVVCGDFMEQNIVHLGRFDVVLMNPPFANAVDIKHILHAVKFLKPNGRLVAICGGGSRQAEALQPLCDTWELLPAGTFKEAGTNVSTVLLSITKQD
jgi:predicted RNA methylase